MCVLCITSALIDQSLYDVRLRLRTCHRLRTWCLQRRCRRGCAADDGEGESAAASRWQQQRWRSAAIHRVAAGGDPQDQASEAASERRADQPRGAAAARGERWGDRDAPRRRRAPGRRPARPQQGRVLVPRPGAAVQRARPRRRRPAQHWPACPRPVGGAARPAPAVWRGSSGAGGGRHVAEDRREAGASPPPGARLAGRRDAPAADPLRPEAGDRARARRQGGPPLPPAARRRRARRRHPAGRLRRPQ